MRSCCHIALAADQSPERSSQLISTDVAGLIFGVEGNMQLMLNISVLAHP